MAADGTRRPADRGGERGVVVILTAITVEYQAVREHLVGPVQELEERGTVYEVGAFVGEQATWQVVMAQSGEGNPEAGIQIERAARTFAPQVVLFVGVAGGRKDVALGDVVAASAVYHYEAAKEAERQLQPRIKTAIPSFRLVQRAMAVAAKDDWQARIKPPPPPRPPRAFVKPIAAGAKLVSHDRSRTARLLDRYSGDALAVEMEGFGFLRGAWANEQVAAIVVRGVSDLLTGKDAASDLEWQPIAARHAAAFAFELLNGLAGQPRRAGDTPPLRTPATAREPRQGDRLFELVDCFLEVPSVADPGSREQVLRLLGADVRAAIPRHPTARFDVLSIIRTCLNYPNALDDLVAAVRALEGDSLPMRRLEEAVTRFVRGARP